MGLTNPFDDVLGCFNVLKSETLDRPGWQHGFHHSVCFVW